MSLIKNLRSQSLQIYPRSYLSFPDELIEAFGSKVWPG
jgi:hypothetical protein